MIRLILLILCFLLSLLCVLPAPQFDIWYISIMASEFSWLFLIITSILLLLGFRMRKYGVAGTVIGLFAIVLFFIPLITAYGKGNTLAADMDSAFATPASAVTGNIFSISNCFTTDEKVPHSTMTYANGSEGPITLDLYSAKKNGMRPCVIVIHGGSWSAGDSRQLPELNSRLAVAGYHVASINYRLAPAHISPAPVEDVQAALTYLRAHAGELFIDTTNFVLLGRSAGGQIALTAAYSLHDSGVKGVVNFYGPTDMPWGYTHPANPLVLNTCKVMEDYLGGPLETATANYNAASAVITATASSVPTLTIHGKNDPLVHYEHAVHLEDKLTTLGVKHYTLSLPWATHGCDYSLHSPSGQLSTYAVLRFLDIVTAGAAK